MDEKANDTVVVRMSETGKRELDRGVSAVAFPESFNPARYPHLYALTPLREGEPMPKQVWMHEGSRVEILSAPVGEERRCVVRWENGIEASVMPSDLRPIPPEPEHREWCVQMADPSGSFTAHGCTCERRKYPRTRLYPRTDGSRTVYVENERRAVEEVE